MTLYSSKPRRPHKLRETTTCLHCGSTCVQMKGSDIYRNAGSSYADKIFHVCPLCTDSRVGCHPDSPYPLGYAANSETRKARMKLHKDMMDPIWLQAEGDERRRARGTVYKFLTYTMGLAEEAHVGEFTLEECRTAWALLSKENYRSIAKFVQQMKEDENA